MAFWDDEISDSFKAIKEAGGSVSVDGVKCESVAAMRRLLKGMDEGALKYLKMNLKSIADAARVAKEQAEIWGKGMEGYRPVLEIHTDRDPAWELHYR